MRLNTLTMTNFIGHESLSVAFKKITRFFGANGAGKSSVKDAIRWAMTGIIRRDPLRYDEKSCSVVLEVNDGIQIQRKKAKTGSPELVVGKGDMTFDGTTTEIQDTLLNQLKVTPEQLDAIFDTSQFFLMSDDQRKNIITKALQIGLTRENVEDWLGKKYGNIRWDKYFESDDLDLDVSDPASEKICIDRRRAAKRLVDDLQHKLDRPIEVENASQESLSKCENRLKEINAELDSLREQKGKVDMLAQLKTQLAESEGRLKAAQGSDHKAVHAVERRLMEARMELDKWQPVKEKYGKRSSGLASEIALQEKMIEDMAALGTSCVLSSSISCPMPKKDASSLVAEAKKSLKELQKEAKLIQSDLDQSSDAIVKANFIISQAQAEIKGLRDVDIDAPAESQKISGLQKQIKEIESAAKAVAKIPELEESRRTGQEHIEKLKSSLKQIAEREEIQSQLEAAQEEVEVNDALAVALGAKGVRSTLLQDATQRINTIANKYFAPFGLGEMSFEIKASGRSEKFSVAVDGKPLENFSTGEQHCISIALQMILAELTGIRIVIIEETNTLTQELKNGLQECISNNLDEFDNIIVLNAADEAPLTNNDMIQDYWFGEVDVAA